MSPHGFLLAQKNEEKQTLLLPTGQQFRIFIEFSRVILYPRMTALYFSEATFCSLSMALVISASVRV